MTDAEFADLAHAVSIAAAVHFDGYPRNSQVMLGEIEATLRAAMEATLMDNADLRKQVESNAQELEAHRTRIDSFDKKCHNKHGEVDARAFADGCAEEQRKLYGCAPDADEVERLQNELVRGNNGMMAIQTSEGVIYCSEEDYEDVLCLVTRLQTIDEIVRSFNTQRRLMAAEGGTREAVKDAIKTLVETNWQQPSKTPSKQIKAGDTAWLVHAGNEPGAFSGERVVRVADCDGKTYSILACVDDTKSAPGGVGLVRVVCVETQEETAGRGRRLACVALPRQQDNEIRHITVNMDNLRPY